MIMMGGSSVKNNPLKKIYSNQSSHKTISWYIQDNHRIVRCLTNKKNLQKQKNQRNQKPLTKSENQTLEKTKIFNNPSNIQKFFRKKN